MSLVRLQGNSRFFVVKFLENQKLCGGFCAGGPVFRGHLCMLEGYALRVWSEERWS